MSRRVASALASAILLMTLIGVSPVLAGAPTTRWVDDDGLAGPINCRGVQLAPTSIQAAVDASLSGDRILVCPGDYVGAVTVDEADNLTIRAVTAWTAHIKPAPDMPPNDHLITINGVSGTTVQWLEVIAPTAGDCAGFHAVFNVVNAPSTSIRANHMGVQGLATILGCGYARGINVDSSPNFVAAWNRIVDPKVSGIIVVISDGVRLRGNVVRYNHVTSNPALGSFLSVGIYVTGGDNVRVVRNFVSSLSTAGASTPRIQEGIVVEGGQTASVRLNRVNRANTGMRIDFHSDSDVIGNLIRNSAGTGLRLTGVSQGSTVSGNVSRNNGGQGILVNGAQTGELTQFNNNDFRFNAGLDCEDATTGSGTAGTAGVWTNNLGIDDSPDGICIDPSAP